MYEFRVIAENEAGRGIPSEPSKLTRVCFDTFNLVRGEKLNCSVFVLQVKDPNAATAPEFVKKLKDTEGNEGRTIRLEAEVKGSPKPDIEWFVIKKASTILIHSTNIVFNKTVFRYRGTKELSKGAKYDIVRDGDICALVINDVSIDDIDEYCIKIRNKGGSRMSRCNVGVRCTSCFSVYYLISSFDLYKYFYICFSYSCTTIPITSEIS